MKFYYSLAASCLIAGVYSACDEESFDFGRANPENYIVDIRDGPKGPMAKISCKKPSKNDEGVKYKDIKAFKESISAVKEGRQPLWGKYKCSKKGEWVPFTPKYGAIGHCPDATGWADFVGNDFRPVPVDEGCTEKSILNKIEMNGWDTSNYMFKQKNDILSIACLAPDRNNKSVDWKDMKAYKEYLSEMRANGEKWGNYKCTRKGSWAKASAKIGDLRECPAPEDWHTDPVKPEKPEKPGKPEKPEKPDDGEEKPEKPEKPSTPPVNVGKKIEKLVTSIAGQLEGFDELKPFHQKKILERVITEFAAFKEIMDGLAEDAKERWAPAYYASYGGHYGYSGNAAPVAPSGYYGRRRRATGKNPWDLADKFSDNDVASSVFEAIKAFFTGEEPQDAMSNLISLFAKDDAKLNDFGHKVAQSLMSESKPGKPDVEKPEKPGKPDEERPDEETPDEERPDKEKPEKPGKPDEERPDEETPDEETPDKEKPEKPSPPVNVGKKIEKLVTSIADQLDGFADLTSFHKKKVLDRVIGEIAAFKELMEGLGDKKERWAHYGYVSYGHYAAPAHHPYGRRRRATGRDPWDQADKFSDNEVASSVFEAIKNLFTSEEPEAALDVLISLFTEDDKLVNYAMKLAQSAFNPDNERPSDEGKPEKPSGEGKPGNGKPGNGSGEGKPATGSDEEKPDKERPDEETPDEETPDEERPDKEKPATGSGEGKPATGSGEGKPATGSGEGKPATGSGEGKPATGSGEGKPANGDGASGEEKPAEDADEKEPAGDDGDKTRPDGESSEDDDKEKPGARRYGAGYASLGGYGGHYAYGYGGYLGK